MDDKKLKNITTSTMSMNKFAYVSLAKIIYVILLIVNCMYVSD